MAGVRHWQIELTQCNLISNKGVLSWIEPKSKFVTKIYNIYTKSTFFLSVCYFFIYRYFHRFW